MHRRSRNGGALLAAAVASLAACTPAAQATDPQDTSFEAMQSRGARAMGVDQHTSTHRFDALADGGRIELQRDVDDPEGVDAIRAHLKRIAEAFASGDFDVPAFVHAGEVPGTGVMAARRSAIAYAYRDLPGGGEVRLRTDHPEALAAIHEFMAFQREQHHAGGAHHPVDPGTMPHHPEGHPRHDGHHRGGDAP